MYRAAAAVIFLVFYGCYFAKMIMQRRKGIRTDQIGKDKEGFVKAVENTMRVATYLVPLVEVTSMIAGWSLLPSPARIAGIVIGILGDTVFIVSVVTMRDNWRAGVSKTDKTELVTGGIYSISRNPAFLGFDLMYLGILLIFFNWGLLGVSLFAAVMFHLQIVNVEEDYLLITFGDAYLDYRKRVNRYLGIKRRKK